MNIEIIEELPPRKPYIIDLNKVKTVDDLVLILKLNRFGNDKIKYMLTEEQYQATKHLLAENNIK